MTLKTRAVTVSALKDMDEVARIMTNEKLFLASMSDPEIEEFKEGTWKPDETQEYVGLYLGGELIGVVRYRFITQIMIEWHWHLLPDYWGTGNTEEFCNLVEEYLRDNTGCLKILVQTPQSCKEVARSASRNGFDLEGILVSCVVWRGRIDHMVLMSKFIKRDK